jgi:microcystin-dependent protein
LGLSNSSPLYRPASVSTDSQLAPPSLTQTGGSQPHTNMQPYLALNFIIAIDGLFPTQ